MKEHRENGHDDKVKHNHHAFRISNKVVVEEGKIADHKPTEDAYKTLRIARSDARLVGKREKRTKAKEEEAAAQKK